MQKLFIVLVLFLFACQSTETKFDRKKWNECPDGFCDYRETMVRDLMINHLHEGMPVNQLEQLLGKPDFKLNHAKNKIAYNIFVDYGTDIDPVETKTLEFDIKDSIIVDFRLEHWKHT